ncbi:hypothetical protein NDU88_010657 [Pleurodeles waltl]|uniref:Uncharacterized protein n=1 Tax=Pleurodeles waltl TaxID=8319 RepID=A0AAV7R0Y3_PLEWA|nr:hypothetical protein NDU88_010657 [Pleurodeles waltl]
MQIGPLPCVAQESAACRPEAAAIKKELDAIPFGLLPKCGVGVVTLYARGAIGKDKDHSLVEAVIKRKGSGDDPCARALTEDWEPEASNPPLLWE